jgi:hypothetical protein
MNHHKPLALTATQRAILTQPKLFAKDRAGLGELWEAFRNVYQGRVRPGEASNRSLLRAFRLCGQMMLTLNCTYWAVTWERLTE